MPVIFARQTIPINKAFEKMAESIREFNCVCAYNGAPLRGVSFRVLNDGSTKLHVTYRRKK